MTFTRDDTEQLLRQPGLREALAEWERKRRPGQLVHVAKQHGVPLSDEEGEALEFQSVLRQSSSYSDRAIRTRR